jgi:subtilisin family serine protease
MGGDNAQAGDHGTAIAGIIAARGALEGVAPDAELLGVTAFAVTGAAQVETGTTAHIIVGMDWALQNRARILNMSFAGPREALMQRAIAAAVKQDAILVAAAGNGGPDAPPAYPAAYPGVVAVTATDIGDRLYAEANRGAYIDLAAPGVDILAPATGDGHLLRSGTSFAAAHVSGLAALLIERNPAMSAAELLRALTATARDLGPSGWDAMFGAGSADALAAISLIRASVSLQ